MIELNPYSSSRIIYCGNIFEVLPFRPVRVDDKKSRSGHRFPWYIIISYWKSSMIYAELSHSCFLTLNSLSCLLCLVSCVLSLVQWANNTIQSITFGKKLEGGRYISMVWVCAQNLNVLLTKSCRKCSKANVGLFIIFIHYLGRESQVLRQNISLAIFATVSKKLTVWEWTFLKSRTTFNTDKVEIQSTRKFKVNVGGGWWTELLDWSGPPAARPCQVVLLITLPAE